MRDDDEDDDGKRHEVITFHLTIYVFIYDVGKEALPSPILTLLLLLLKVRHLSLQSIPVATPLATLSRSFNFINY